MKLFQILSSFVVFCILIALGVWQIQRHDWKQNIIQEYHATRQLDRFVIESADLVSQQYQNVLVSGRILPGLFFQAPPQKRQPGVFVIVPIELKNKDIVFVFAGWVSDQARNDIKFTGKANIKGVAMPAWPGNKYTPVNNIKDNIWFDMKFDEMCQAVSCQRTFYPYLVQASHGFLENVSPEPLAIDFHDRHLQYASTWFTLAFALVVIAVLFFRRRKS